MSENKDDILHVVGGKPLNGTIKVRGAKGLREQGHGGRIARSWQIRVEERAGDS